MANIANIETIQTEEKMIFEKLAYMYGIASERFVCSTVARPCILDIPV